MSIAEMPEETAGEIEELSNLVPKVLENLKTEGQVETYIAFNRLVAENSLPLTNYSLSVVPWYCKLVLYRNYYPDEIHR